MHASYHILICEATSETSFGVRSRSINADIADSAKQRDLLDSFAGIIAEREAYAATFSEFSAVAAKIRAMPALIILKMQYAL